MAKLILVKHSLPELDERVPASRWRLSAVGRRRCGLLAKRLSSFRPAVIVASTEPKASETAQSVAQAWGQEYGERPGLHEHRRETVGWLEKAAFEAGVKAMFEAPEALAFGEETAVEAARRFALAVHEAAAQSEDQNLVVVAHGTVIALYAAATAGADGFALWRRLGLPAYVVFERAGGAIETVVETLEA